MNRNEKDHWRKGVLTAAVIFLLFSLYLFLRRGYYSLYIANKAFGSSAAILAGLSLVVGPLAKHLFVLVDYVSIRRHMGLLALLFGMVHAVISLFLLPQKFPVSWYQQEWVPVIFGATALALWVYLASISTSEKLKTLGADIWQKHQRRFGHISFLAIFLHLTIMKYPGWIRWLRGQVQPSSELANPSYPPASLFVLLALIAVLLYKGALFLKRR